MANGAVQLDQPSELDRHQHRHRPVRHDAVAQRRARAQPTSRGIKPEAGEQPDNDLREIVFKKNQYGRISESIVLRYQSGLYLPLPGVTLDQAAKAAVAEDVFLTLLDRFTDQNRSVYATTGKSYAPALFAAEIEASTAGLTDREPRSRHA